MCILDTNVVHSIKVAEKNDIIIIKITDEVKEGDIIVFDSVSRMSRNAAEGFKDYKALYEAGIHLEFINEPLINTSVFDSTRNNLLNVNIETGNTAVDDFFKGNITPAGIPKIKGLKKAPVLVSFVMVLLKMADLLGIDPAGTIAVGDYDNDIDPGTAWEDLDDDFVCPLCGVSKDEFESDNY